MSTEQESREQGVRQPECGDEDARFFAGMIVTSLFGLAFYWLVYKLYVAFFS